MYLVKLINDNIETYINTVNVSNEANRITGQMKFGINTIDSFTFTIYPNNTGYNLIFPLKTLVEVINTKTNVVEFKGRVLLPKQSMSDSGLIAKTVVCESELGYLLDSNQRYGEYHNVSVRGFLEIMIDNHNKQVSEDKRFTVGQVTVVDNNDSLYRFLGYEKTLDTIKDKLINRLGGELRIRYENGIRYLDYLTKIGHTSTTEIRLAKNLKSIEEEKDPSQVITRLVPLGAKLKTTDEEGNEVETEERLTISNVNGGKDYIDDVEAIKVFGIIEATEKWDDVNIDSILLSKGKSFLNENNKVKKKYSINALDLSLIGIDFESIDIFNTYKVINPIMGIDEYLRVIEKTVDIENPQNSSISVGDKFADIKQYQINIKKSADIIKEVDSKVNNTISKVNKIENDVITVGGELGNLEGGIGETSENILQLSNTVNTLSNMVTDNTEKINTLEGINSIIQSDISQIKTNIATINTDIKQIKSDNTLMKTDISTLKTNMDTVKSDITGIKEDIVDINTKLDKILTSLGGV